MYFFLVVFFVYSGVVFFLSKSITEIPIDYRNDKCINFRFVKLESRINSSYKMSSVRVTREQLN